MIPQTDRGRAEVGSVWLVDDGDIDAIVWFGGQKARIPLPPGRWTVHRRHVSGYPPWRKRSKQRDEISVVIQDEAGVWAQVWEKDLIRDSRLESEQRILKRLG